MKTTLFTAILALLCLVAAACGGGGGDDDVSAPTTTAGPATTAASDPMELDSAPSELEGLGEALNRAGDLAEDLSLDSLSEGLDVAGNLASSIGSGELQETVEGVGEALGEVFETGSDESESEESGSRSTGGALGGIASGLGGVLGGIAEGIADATASAFGASSPAASTASPTPTTTTSPGELPPLPDNISREPAPTSTTTTIPSLADDTIRVFFYDGYGGVFLDTEGYSIVRVLSDLVLSDYPTYIRGVPDAVTKNEILCSVRLLLIELSSYTSYYNVCDLDYFLELVERELGYESLYEGDFFPWGLQYEPSWEGELYEEAPDKGDPGPQVGGFDFSVIFYSQGYHEQAIELGQLLGIQIGRIMPLPMVWGEDCELYGYTFCTATEGRAYDRAGDLTGTVLLPRGPEGYAKLFVILGADGLVLNL